MAKEILGYVLRGPLQVPLLFLTAIVFVYLAWLVQREEDRLKEQMRAALYDAARATVLSGMLCCGVASLVIFMPDMMRTPIIQSEEGTFFALATATAMFLEAIFIGVLAFWFFRAEERFGLHQWQRERSR